MPFASRCDSEFNFGVRTRGEEYFREGRVRLTPGLGRSVRAEVAGSSGDYEVVVDWSDADDGFVEASCTCPYFDDRGQCKHIWAAMLATDSRGIGPPPGRGLRVLEAESDEWDADDNLDEGPEDDEEEDGRAYPFRRPDPRRSPGRRGASAGRSPRGATWRHQLADVFQDALSLNSSRPAFPVLGKRREAWYVLDIASSLETGALVIHFFHHETKQNGEFGKLRPLSVREDAVHQFAPPGDCEMIGMLLASDPQRDQTHDSYRERYGYDYGHAPRISMVSVGATAHEHVLPRLCASGRLVWMLDTFEQTPEEDGHALAWDDGPPWRLQLCIAPDDERRQWRLEGKLVREGQEGPIPLSSPALLVGGVVVLEDRMARLDAGGVFPWIAALRKSPVIEVPYQDRWELLEHLWRLPSLPQTSLPVNLGCKEVRLPPQGRLVVHSPQQRYGPNRLCGDVHFQYDGKRVAAKEHCAGIVDADNQRILVRDRQEEQRLLARLAEQGARAADFGEHDVWIPDQRFSGLVAALVEAGWIVEAEGRLFRKAGQWRLSVTSGIDWFDLEGTCDFDGQTVRLPDLLEARRRGEGYVRLGDGSRGLLPQEWLAQFAPLVEMGSAEGEQIRFRPSQALLLDALLAAHKQVSVDRQFAHMRRKLRSFDGVSPRKEPRGFQGELRNYQKDGLGWLDFLRDFRLGGCLADDMGLGKTVQVLAQLQSRRLRAKNGNGCRTTSLVVVPRSLVFNWIEEARRFTPNLRVLDYTGTVRRGALEQLDQYDLVVTTYGTLCRDIAQFKDIRFDYVILDEAQAIKNAQSQRAKVCRLLQADHRLAATGTPVENHLGELWSLFEFLNPGMLGRSSAFQALSKKMTAETENLALLRRALAPFILRRTKEQVLPDLPEKTEQTLYCDLTGSQRKHYNQLRDYYRASLSKRIQETGMAKAKIHVLEALLRLRQGALHPGLLDQDRLDESSVKLDVLVEQLAEVIDEGHKALVFSQFTSFLAIVRRRLDAEKIVYEYLDGQTRDRKGRVDRFQNDPACPLFLISLKAGGHGLNLTAADYVFLLDPWWNPAVEAQAVDRTHRIGQTRQVFAYRLIARDTVEEKVIELQKTKRELAEAIISADANVLRQLTAEDLQMLLS